MLIFTSVSGIPRREKDTVAAMATPQKTDTPHDTTLPAPEVLQPKANEDGSSVPAAPPSSGKPAQSAKQARDKLRRKLSYRPSHKATFIGVSVVAGILLLNVAIITFVMQSQSSAKAESALASVTLNPGVLDKLGVSRNAVGSSGTELVVGPNAHFNGGVVVGADMSIAGELKLNSKFTASDASLAKLEAGDTSVSNITINGDATASTLNLRQNLNVAGATQLQGAVTVSQLLTVNNNVNIAGNLAVGGTLTARNFQASSLTSDTTLTIGGHIISRGSAPGVGPGPALGANGTVSISGNDASGTVAANIGTGAGDGILAQIAFRNQYGTTPHVVVSAVGMGVSGLYVNRSVGGFSIGVSGGLPPGGYAFDFIVMQ